MELAPEPAPSGMSITENLEEKPDDDERMTMPVETPQPQPQPTPTMTAASQRVTTVASEDEEDPTNMSSMIQPTPSNTTHTTSMTTAATSAAASRSRQYVTPRPGTHHTGSSLVLSTRGTTASATAATPIDEAVKLDGPEFEQIMKERARMRREKEDSHVAELRVKVARLEHALAAETKRRVEATRQLEKQAKEELQHWEDRCRAELQEQRALVEDRLEKLELRMNALEDRWQRDCQQQKDTINKKGQEFETALEELRKEAETERKLREVREGQFFQQIEAKGKDYEDRWDKEREERIASVSDIVHQVETNEEERRLGRNALEIRLEEELDQLRRDFEEERIERMKADDGISDALDKYAVQFQQSLNILNSDDLYGV